MIREIRDGVDVHDHAGHQMDVNGMAVSATLHCLTGCAIGEVLGVVIGTALGLANGPTIALGILLAFVFGYSLTSLPLLPPASRWPPSSRSRWRPTPSRSRRWRSWTTRSSW